MNFYLFPDIVSHSIALSIHAQVLQCFNYRGYLVFQYVLMPGRVSHHLQFFFFVSVFLAIVICLFSGMNFSINVPNFIKWIMCTFIRMVLSLYINKGKAVIFIMLSDYIRTGKSFYLSNSTYVFQEYLNFFLVQVLYISH